MTTHTDPRLAALRAVYDEAGKWADGEAVTAYVMLENAVGRFLDDKPADEIRNSINDA